MSYLVRVARQLRLWSWLLVCACNIEPSAHPDYRAECDDGHYLYMGLFCLERREDAGKQPTPDAQQPDAGQPGQTDAGQADASELSDSGEPDSSHGGSGGAAGAEPHDAGQMNQPDSGPVESCPEPDNVETCYPLSDATTSLQPPCKAGVRTCSADNVWGECAQYRLPEAESCDGVDSDCDGKTDEAATPTANGCTVDEPDVKGECKKDGVPICRDGRLSCLQYQQPAAEGCNDLDDDCDGATDEGLDVACYTGMVGCTDDTAGGFACVPQSSCAPGSLRCVQGVMQTECEGQVLPASEDFTQAGETPFDEDCDGTIDELFSCTLGDTFPCYTGPAETRGQTPCRDGIQQCVSGQIDPNCMGERTPQPETCDDDGVDDDCNGVLDDVPGRGASCSDESSALGICKRDATLQCVGALVCVDGTAGSEELCDQVPQDEDCDGQSNEGFDLQNDEANCGSCGHSCAVAQSCCAGTCVDTRTSNLFCGSCTSSCGAGLTCCSSICKNTRSDGQNCGTCGHACLLGCSNGLCNLL